MRRWRGAFHLQPGGVEPGFVRHLHHGAIAGIVRESRQFIRRAQGRQAVSFFHPKFLTLSAP
jgi:hypothetical protein